MTQQMLAIWSHIPELVWKILSHLHYVYRCVSRLVISKSLRPRGLKPTRLLYPWDSPGKNTGVGSHSLLQGIYTTQGWNQGLLHCRQILYHLSHQESLHLHFIYKKLCYIRFWISCDFFFHPTDFRFFLQLASTPRRSKPEREWVILGLYILFTCASLPGRQT